MSLYAFVWFCVHTVAAIQSLSLSYLVFALNFLKPFNHWHRLSCRLAQSHLGSIIRAISDAGLTPKLQVSGLLNKHNELKRPSSEEREIW